MCVRRKPVPSSSHTALAPPECPFHLGSMSFCTVLMDCEDAQLSWRDFSTTDFPGQQSLDPDSHEIDLEIQCNSHQHTGPPPAPFSPPDKFTSTKSVFPHKPYSSHGDLFQDRSPAIPTLVQITVTGKKTTATASPSLPKMDFIRVLLLAMGLLSPYELQKRDVSADSK